MSARRTLWNFSDPGISKQQLTPELLADWDVKVAGLNKWTCLFLLASQLTEDGPASAAAMEAQNDFAQKAEAFQTKSGQEKSDGRGKISDYVACIPVQATVYWNGLQQKT